MKLEKLLTFFFVFLLRVCTTQYSLSVSSPFLLTNNLANIVTVGTDLQDQSLVSFQDGQARRYSSDFSAFTTLNVPQTVQKFSSFSLRLESIQLSNSTIFTMLSNMTATLSNNFTTLRVYTYPAFTQFQSYNFAQPVLDYQGLPLFTLSLEPFHVLVFNRTTKVIYKGIATTAFDFNQSFGSFNVAVVFKQYVLAYGGDFINLTYAYVHKLGTLGLIQVNITLSFRFNYTSSTYDLTVSSNFFITSSFSMNVQTMLIANGLVLMQMKSTSTLRSYGKLINFLDYFDFNILNNGILDFFYVFDTYYVLFTKGLVALTIDELSGIFLLSTSINTLPINAYELTFGANIDLLFVPGTPYIYKAKCLNQTAFSAGTCVSYNCSVPNCDLCPLTASTCGTCASGFTRTDAFTCVDPNANNTTSNATASANVSQPSNSSASSNSSGSVSAFSSEGESSAFSSMFPFLEGFQELISSMLNGTKVMMAVPSLRSVSPTFYFFATFDDLYLYSFHDRHYGSVMSELFGELGAIENMKWSLFGYGKVLKLFGVSNSSFFRQIDYQSAYTTYRFSTPGLPHQGSEALLVRCTNFFLVSVPLTVIFFLLFRFLFRLLFNHPISKIFRKFDFWGCLFIVLFDGNIQQFVFYCVAEWRNVFFFSLGDKYIKVFTVCFGFVLVTVSVGGYLIAYTHYRRLNMYLVDNNKNSLAGVSFLLLQHGLKNFVFGVLHSVLRILPYKAMIVVLLSAQLFFTLLFVLSFTLRIYKKASFMWFYVLLSIFRILLILSLAFDYGVVNEHVIESVQCTLIVFMLFTYLIGSLAATSSFFAETLQTITSVFKSKPIHKPKPSKASQNHIDVIFFPSIAPLTADPKPIHKDKKGRFFLKRAPKGQNCFTINKRILRIVEVEAGVKQHFKTRVFI